MIQSSLKRLEYVSHNNNLYTVSAAMVMNEIDVVSSTVESISVTNESIANNLIKYVEDRKGTLSVENCNESFVLFYWMIRFIMDFLN